MSLVLYRKYRPQSFSEIVGQEHIVQTLTNAIASGMVSHAYIFAGPRGSGKTTLARLLAKAVNCQNRGKNDAEPCNKCASCLEIMEGRPIDLIEIDAASNRGIDDIRALKDGIKFAPTKEKYKMIPTIISRCQRFDFKKLTLIEIVKRLKIVAEKEKAKIDESAIELIALNSGGSFRDAESLLDQVLTFTGVSGKKGEIGVEDIKDLLGLIEIGLVSKFCDFLIEKKAKEAIEFLNDIMDRGMDVQEFAKAIISYLRQAFIVKVAADDAISIDNPLVAGLTKEELEKMTKQAKSFDEKELSRCLNLFLEAENKMRFSPIQQLPLELAIIEHCVPGEK